MKATVLAEDFSKALSFCSRFVSTRAALPILGNVLLRAEKTRLQLMATNLEASLVTTLGAKVEETGDIAIPARVLVDIVTNLARGPVSLETEGEQVKVSSEGFRGAISGMNGADFPAVPQSLGKGVLIKKDELLEALTKVSFSASADETRPVLTGVLFIFSGSGLTLVATDGFRLSQKKVAKLEAKEARIIIPKGALSEISRLAGEESEEIKLEIKEGDNQAVFGIGEKVMATRVIEGEFPNFERIIPKESKTRVDVDKEELRRAVKLASVFARESANIVKLMVKKDSVSISSESAKSGKQEASLEAKVEGEGLEIAYNYRFIEEFLNVVEGESVQMSFGDSATAGVFRDAKDPDFLHLIMPVRIQN